jgi:hypothetical protein
MENVHALTDPEHAMAAAAGVVTVVTQDRSAAVLPAEDDPVTRMLMSRFPRSLSPTKLA